MRRRKEPDSGVGPHTAGAADQEGAVVERWFGHLDNKTIRRGVFLSVADLQAAIDTFVTVWNLDPKPFVWTATVESNRKSSLPAAAPWSPRVLHADQRVVAEHGRALLSRSNPESNPPRCISRRRRVDHGDRRVVHRPSQQQSQTIHLDREGHRHI